MPRNSCTSCKRSISNFRVARFKCPACSGSEVVRCTDCRANVVAYKCGKCNFKGPN